MCRTLFLLLLAGVLGGVGCSSSERADPVEPRIPTTSYDASTFAPRDPFAEADSSGAGLDSLRLPADLALLRLGGDTLRLSDYRGRVLLVNFWATWCPPCRVEIPDLVALHEELHEDGLTVIGVALDEEGAEVVRPFAERFGITYPVVVEGEALAEAAGGVYGLPTTFVIGRDGLVQRRVLGLFPVDEIRPVLRAMLETPE